MSKEGSKTPQSDSPTITEHEAGQIDRANKAGETPVVFVHGLWLLPSSWDRWAELFEKNGYTSLTPGWPDDPETVEEAEAHPEVFAKKVRRPGRRSLRGGHPWAEQEAGDRRPLVRRAACTDPGRSGPVRRDGGHRPGAVPRGVAVADLRAASRLPVALKQSRRTTIERYRSPTTSSGTGSPTP